MVAQESDLTFAQDGDDLLVSLVVMANNSPHVLWTRAFVQTGKVIPAGGTVAQAKPANRVSLMYCLIQNRDLFRRSNKSVVVKWRLPNRTREDKNYVVERCFSPMAAEWRELSAELNALMGSKKDNTTASENPENPPILQ